MTDTQRPQRPIDSTYRNKQGRPVEGPISPTANSRIDTTLDYNQPLEPQATGLETDDAMARSEQWADGTKTRTVTTGTRADQARARQSDDVN